MAPLLRRTGTDDRAFEKLYQRHVRDVFRYSLAVLGEPADAEDVTQTTFLNAYRAYQRGERPQKPENWLISIAHNVCRQRFRQAQRRPHEVEYADEVSPAIEESDGPTAEDLRRAFSHLPPNQRAALVMRELEGRSYAEIAEVLGITVSALETLLFRARRTLREQLEEQLTCRDAELAISRQMDGRLSHSERGALRAHLRACPECARLAQSQRAQRKVLRGLLAVPLPPGLTSFFHPAAEAAATTAVAATATATGTGVAVKAAAVVAGAALVGGGTYAGVEKVPALVKQRPHRAAAAKAPVVVPAAPRAAVATRAAVTTPAATVAVAKPTAGPGDAGEHRRGARAEGGSHDRGPDRGEAVGHSRHGKATAAGTAHDRGRSAEAREHAPGQTRSAEVHAARTVVRERHAAEKRATTTPAKPEHRHAAKKAKKKEPAKAKAKHRPAHRATPAAKAATAKGGGASQSGQAPGHRGGSAAGGAAASDDGSHGGAPEERPQSHGRR